MKKTTLWFIVGIIVVIGGLLFWSRSLQESDPDVIARNGIHWHPTLAIYVNDERQEIPANIGLGAGHQPIHTHDEDVAQGVIHLEFEGAVRSSDVLLNNFFLIWNKDIMTAFGTLDRMVVNGEENTEYGNYMFQENDQIELYYVDVARNDLEE